MFSLPGIAAVLAFLYLRPLDIFPTLRGIPFFQVFFALAVLGFLLDLRLGALRIARSPLTTLVLVWAAWTLVVTASHGTEVLGQAFGTLLFIVIFYVVLAHGIQTMKGVSGVIGLLLIIVALLTFVGVHQSTRPLTCVALDAEDPVEGPAHPDGRPCERPEDCKVDPPLPDADYVCEKVGVFDIYSGNGRVRYTGLLRDANELALVVSLGIPILYAFVERKRNAVRWTAAVVLTLGILYCVVQTASRGGVLVVGAVALVLAVRRLGLKGIILPAILIVPLLVLGGSNREGDEQSESSQERIEAQFLGLMLIRAYPLQGVGMTQFTEHHYLTAHNSYILTASELGFIGGVLWTALLYLAAKISFLAFVRYRNVVQAATASQMGFVLTGSFAGLGVGIFFLSFAYHIVLWTYLGLAGALYGAIRARDPDFNVELSWREFLAIAGAKAALLTLLFVYLRGKV